MLKYFETERPGRRDKREGRQPPGQREESQIKTGGVSGMNKNRNTRHTTDI